MLEGTTRQKQQPSNGQACNECHFLSSSTPPKRFLPQSLYTTACTIVVIFGGVSGMDQDLTHVISVDIYCGHCT